jgi:NADPH-dependent glutamate synthase beta subunit-like oxidoreductase
MGIPLQLEYYDKNIPCMAACPVHTNAGAYVAAIAEGDDLTAYLTARMPNPFASVCGRVCAAPCEDACRRGEVDSPIAIRALKRFVTEKFGPEASPYKSHVEATDRPERKQSIGIVGGGPAGLSAAHDLRLHGYQVTIYEATDILGGMMVLGIPEYRLDRSLVQREIDAILGLGVEVEMHTKVGVDVTFEELRKRHDGVVLTLGATLGRGLDIPGNDADGVFKALEFLININQGFSADIGEKVVVIGGGNVAMDAARTALRAAEYGEKADDSLEVEDDTSLSEAVDVARTAVRAGAKDVTVVALESPEEMPAAEFEIEEAEVEGIVFRHRLGPEQIEVSDGKVTGLSTVKVLSVFNEEGRFAPTFDTEVKETIEADTVILAIGQAIDLDAIGGDAGPAISPRRTIETDPTTFATSLPNVWAAGDAAFGPRNLIDAIAEGRKVAEDVHRTFGGESNEAKEGVLLPLRDFHRLEDMYDRVPRHDIPTLPTNRRIGLAEVETGFSEQEARAEAQRCLRCFSNIQLDTGACVLCGLCADVCPFNLISLVPASDFDADATGTALLLDESTCIRCALCVERCPTKALSMSTWIGAGALPEPVLSEVNA